MTRFVIGPDVAIRLAHGQSVIRGDQQIPPTLLRSQVLSLLYQADIWTYYAQASLQYQIYS
jgi:hypothetical protein